MERLLQKDFVKIFGQNMRFDCVSACLENFGATCNPINTPVCGNSKRHSELVSESQNTVAYNTELVSEFLENYSKMLKQVQHDILFSHPEFISGYKEEIMTRVQHDTQLRHPELVSGSQKQPCGGNL